MHEALAGGEYERLSRVAHTIKGSFGSLHAEPARLHAGELEVLANTGDGEACRRLDRRFGIRFGDAPAAADLAS